MYLFVVNFLLEIFLQKSQPNNFQCKSLAFLGAETVECSTDGHTKDGVKVLILTAKVEHSTISALRKARVAGPNIDFYIWL